MDLSKKSFAIASQFARARDNKLDCLFTILGLAFVDQPDGIIITGWSGEGGFGLPKQFQINGHFSYNSEGYAFSLKGEGLFWHARTEEELNTFLNEIKSTKRGQYFVQFCFNKEILSVS